MLGGSRALIRVPPHRNESLRGYLMRVAAKNDIRHADEVLERVFGESRIRVTPARAMRLADYCRCDVPEFIQLFGIEQRTVDNERQWQLGGEYVTKDYFTRMHRPSVCPMCLLEGSVLKGQWELTFYVVCPRHSIALVEFCPRCARRLTPHRRVFERCDCGFLLERAPLAVAPPEMLFVAALVERRLEGLQFLSLPEGGLRADTEALERLAGLSLDALFKTLWILGHLAEAGRELLLGHGRSRPGAVAALDLVRGALSLLAHWPNRFLRLLEERKEEFDREGLHSPSAYLMPLRRYLESEFPAGEAAFVHAAYSRFVLDAWRLRCHSHRARTRHNQLELF